ncbi:hypothetical protein CsatA_015770 [Cannabis sativa]
MDANLQSSSPDNSDIKTAFRKPTTDAANRKYRRHSPVSRSSSDGSPEHDYGTSPKYSGEDPGRVHEIRSRRKDDGREVGRDSERSNYGRGSDTDRHSDRQFSRSSRGYSRHDDYSRHDKHADEEERKHHRQSSRSGRESRGSTHFDNYRSKDNFRNSEKSFRDKYDSSYKSMDKAESGRRQAYPEDTRREKRKMEKDGQDDKKDFVRSSGDYRGDRMQTNEEFKGHRSDSSFRRDDGKHHSKESYKSELKESDGGILTKEGRRSDDVEAKRSKDRCIGESAEQFVEKSVINSENQESFSKRPKFSLKEDNASLKNVSKSTTMPDVKESSSKQPENAKLTAQANSDITSDINAAKVAAMKAAELVNKNLVGGVGTGFMTTDQKKKLLWGNKKATKAEESGHRWDTALFTDRERQEKFNKLMSLSLPWCLWPIVGCEGRTESGSQTRKPRRWRPSIREAKGTADGFREAIHCWAAQERWAYCWTRPLSINHGALRYPDLNFPIWSAVVLFSCARLMFLLTAYLFLEKHNVFTSSFALLCSYLDLNV